MIRIKAKNPRRTHGYYCEPYTVQHLLDGLWLAVTAIPRLLWFAFRHLTTENTRPYNQPVGTIPARICTLNDDERTS